jgi:type I restriction enzyme S subunit
MDSVKLVDICSIEKGQQIDTSRLNDAHRYRYINGGVKESGFYDSFNSNEECVLVSEGGSCGFVNYINEPFWCGCHCYRLHDSKVILKYLYYALKANQERIMDLKTGVCLPNIKKKDFQNFVISIDKDTKRQNAIVKVLDTIQKAIDIKNNQLDRLNEMIESKFQKQFGDPIENEKGWEMREWKDLFDTILGKMLDIKKQNIDDETRCYLGNTNVRWFSFDLNNLKTMTFSNKEIEKLSLKKGDIMVCEGGESGRCAVWEKEGSDILFQKAIHRARLKDPTVIEPHFIPFLMKYLRDNEGLKKHVSQSTIEHLTGEKLDKLSIIVPPFDQQKCFAEFVRKVDTGSSIIKQEISDLEELMDSKMDEYFG